MGLETAILVGLTGLSAIGQMRAGQDQAKQIVKEGNIAVRNKAQEVQLKTARLQTSFLSSGLTLEGTPNLAIQGAYDVGLQDLRQLRGNYNAKAKNAISSARSAALGTIATAVAGASFSSGAFSDMFSTAGSYMPDSFAYGLNEAGFGNMSYDMLQKSDMRAGFY